MVSEFRFDLACVIQPFDPSTEFILSKVEGLRTGTSTSFKLVSILDKKAQGPKQKANLLLSCGEDWPSMSHTPPPILDYLLRCEHQWRNLE